VARKVFFSFHFQRDSWRVGQVRNCWMVKPDHIATPFLDAADWEKVSRLGDAVIKKWIDDQLAGTSVTAVLIGNETSTRPWVRYEIEQSWNRGNGLIGIWIHNIKGRDQRSDIQGQSPFNTFTVGSTPMSQMVKTYDWVLENGRQNVESWVEAAAKARGK
jgi:hypothetical protein